MFTAFAGLAVALFLIAGLSVHAAKPLALSDYNRYQCTTGSGTGEVFDILTLAPQGAFQLADRLCASPRFGRRFGQVAVTWHARRFLNAAHIVNEEYDYFWNREHVVSGLVPTIADYYRPVVKTPDYFLYWFSRRESPTLTQAFFDGKKVGFVDDTRSQTFFLQPFKALKEAGIELREGQKVFFPDHQSLSEAFRSGEIDVMTGLQRPDRSVLDGINYFTLRFRDRVPSGYWYLRQPLLSPDILCPLIMADNTSRVMGAPGDPLVAIDCGRDR